MNPGRVCAAGSPVLLLGFLLACAADGDPGPPGAALTLTGTRSVTLEESDTLVNISPRVSVTSDGQILVVESSQGNVRVHGADGRLSRVLGRPGQGPGEFQMPLQAVGVGSRIWPIRQGWIPPRSR